MCDTSKLAQRSNRFRISWDRPKTLKGNSVMVIRAKYILTAVTLVGLLFFANRAKAEEFVDYGKLEIVESYKFASDMADWNTSVIPRNVNSNSEFIDSAVQVSQGMMAITAESVSPTEYTSGSVVSSLSMKSGYVEALIRLPSAEGAWPTFTLSDDEGNEIRLVETVDPDLFYVSSFSEDDKFTYSHNPTDRLDQFHLYSASWDSGSIKWYFDGKVIAEHKDASWTSNLRATMSLDVGGWAGSPEASDYPARMEIDYVNFYRQTTNPAHETSHHVEEVSRDRPITFGDLEKIIDIVRSRLQSGQ